MCDLRFVRFWSTRLYLGHVVGHSMVGWALWYRMNKQYLQNYVKILNHNHSLWLNWVGIEPCRLFMVHLLLYNINTYQHLQNCWIWTWLGLRFSFIILDFAQRWRLKSGYDPEHDLPRYQAVQRQNVAQLDTRLGPAGNHMANCQNRDFFCWTCLVMKLLDDMGNPCFLTKLTKQSMNSRVHLLVGVNSCLLEWPSCRGHDAVMPRRPPFKWSHPFIHLPTFILRCWKSLTLWAFVSSGMESVVHRSGMKLYTLAIWICWLLFLVTSKWLRNVNPDVSPWL